jgi:membrane associated rhomboid family serine protease
MAASAQLQFRMIWLLPWDEDASVRHMPWATWSLIAINVLVLPFRWLRPLHGLVPHLGADPGEPALVRVHQLQLRAFRPVPPGREHAFPVVFGDNVEDAFGPIPFLLLYFLGGLAGDWMFMQANPTMDIPCAGASGCIATLAGAYLVLFFSSSIGVRLMLFVFPIRTFHVATVWVLLFWFGADVFLTFALHGVLPDGVGTNYVAHGAGFAIGVVVALLAALFGVRRRYEEMSAGHPWLGYWPLDPETRPRKRARPLPPTDNRPPS